MDLLASSDRIMVAPLDVRRIRLLLDFAARHYRYVVLDVPRADAAISTRSSLPPGSSWSGNQELATVRSASRMAAALRQRYGKDRLTVVVSRADRLAEIGHEDVERAVGSQVRHSFPERLSAGLPGAQQGPSGDAREPQRSLRRFHDLCSRRCRGSRNR